MARILAIAANLAATLCAFGAIWCVMVSLELLSRIELAMRAKQYAPATLVVQKVVREFSGRGTRQGGRNSTDPTTQWCYAQGSVDGLEERLTLSDCTGGLNLPVLTSQAAVGDSIEVLINVSMSSSGPMKGRRTLRFQPDLPAASWQRVLDALPVVYAPMLVPAMVALLLWSIGRVFLGRGSGLWCWWLVAIALLLQGFGMGILIAVR